MLVLSRLLGEKVVLQTAHGEITVTVKSIHRGKIRLGIDAPKDVPIWRSELLPARPTGEQR